MSRNCQQQIHFTDRTTNPRHKCKPYVHKSIKQPLNYNKDTKHCTNSYNQWSTEHLELGNTLESSSLSFPSLPSFLPSLLKYASLNAAVCLGSAVSSCSGDFLAIGGYFTPQMHFLSICSETTLNCDKCFYDIS